ncbi:MAG: tRNA (adenosine(37)-N6)-threonylcarbamoyltransferase complex dimerization subunit type 1 TsaB [Chloroflexi bacterium]|nr:tRNA (adenosine(37)-N6)-threonylcarbamoyltransferase complex dimerization subunit type 1 TsaB [Chloroflexota bacterium]
MLLAIDTATRYASVALYGGRGVAAEHSWLSHNNHTVEMAPAIAAMLAQQGVASEALTAVAVAKGPGSFTGLRIGMSLAKGLALALGIPIIGVPTLDIIAYAAGDPGMPVVAVLEAGRGRLSVATYRFRDGLPEAQGDVAIVRTADWAPEADEPLLLTGELSPELVDRLLAEPDAEHLAISTPAGCLRRAGYLAELGWERLQQGEVDDLDALSPLYAHQPTTGSES